MKITVVLMFVLSFIMTNAAFAGDKPSADNTSYEAYMSKGKAYLQEKKYEEAVKAYREALKGKPSDEAANLALGIALSRLSQDTAQLHLKKALMVNPNNPQTNLELGVYYYNKEIYVEARDYLETTVETGKGTEYETTALGYLKKIDRQIGARPWFINLTLGGQYDSNVVLSHDASAMPAGISRKADWKELVYINGRYKFVDTERIEASAGYSFYQTLQTRLSAFNITQNTADLSLRYHIMPALSVGAQYAFEYILFGGKTYDHAHSIGPSLFISEGNGFTTEVKYTYRSTRFYNGDLFLTNSDRNGADNAIGIAQLFPLTEAANLELGYDFDKADAEIDYWRYNGNKLHANLMYNLPYRILLNLYAEYYPKRYEGIFSTYNKTRDDDTQTYSLTATKLFTDSIGVTLGQTYVYNKSNINSYDYKRSLSSLLLNLRF
ncbi:MAG: tetratricopeptide repeat protein [Nitrospirae bacterium]|nr:tetratricopeptide repeat protein [Nitrospirota bacterium]MBF0590485.1 tetratricopeptide repeat protein [Nitrospirota bacterium]